MARCLPLAPPGSAAAGGSRVPHHSCAAHQPEWRRIAAAATCRTRHAGGSPPPWRADGLFARQPRVLRQKFPRVARRADSAPRDRAFGGSGTCTPAPGRAAVGFGLRQRHHRPYRSAGASRCRRTRFRHQPRCAGRGASQCRRAGRKHRMGARLMVCGSARGRRPV